MLSCIYGDLFKSNAEAWINACNCSGVMGAGIAWNFKQRFPDMFQEYNKICKEGRLTIGSLHFFETNHNVPKFIINFPTKDDWQKPSQYVYIEKGLKTLTFVIKTRKIKSLAMPALGCGNGGLDYQKIEKLIFDWWQKKLTGIDLELFKPLEKKYENR